MAIATAPEREEVRSIPELRRQMLEDVLYIGPSFDRDFRQVSAEHEANPSDVGGQSLLDVRGEESQVNSYLVAPALAWIAALDEVVLRSIAFAGWWDKPGTKDIFRRLFTDAGLADRFDEDAEL